METNPERFVFFLSGNTDTNRPRSELPRRIRLQQASLTYALLLSAGIQVYRDEKPLLFQISNTGTFQISQPTFYHSRELKELGAETIKIGNSRLMGVLLAPNRIYAVFFCGESLIKWENRTELKVKALLSYHASRGLLSKASLSPGYTPDTPIHALFIGAADTAIKLLSGTGGKIAISGWTGVSIFSTFCQMTLQA